MRKKNRWVITLYVQGITNDQVKTYNKKIYDNIGGVVIDETNRIVKMFRDGEVILVLKYGIEDIIEIRDSHKIKKAFWEKKK